MYGLAAALPLGLTAGHAGPPSTKTTVPDASDVDHVGGRPHPELYVLLCWACWRRLASWLASMIGVAFARLPGMVSGATWPLLYCAHCGVDVRPLPWHRSETFADEELPVGDGLTSVVLRM